MQLDLRASHARINSLNIKSKFLDTSWAAVERQLDVGRSDVGREPVPQLPIALIEAVESSQIGRGLVKMGARMVTRAPFLWHGEHLVTFEREAALATKLKLP